MKNRAPPTLEELRAKALFFGAITKSKKMPIGRTMWCMITYEDGECRLVIDDTSHRRYGMPARYTWFGSERKALTAYLKSLRTKPTT